MKEILISTLRNKNTSMPEFREASYKLGLILAIETSHILSKTKTKIQTPLAKASGFQFENDIVLVPILRSGLALLPPFLTYFPNTTIGCIGLRRDEKTAIAQLYYKNLPKIKKTDDVILLDPMIATGGSACAALRILEEEGITQDRIIFNAIISSPIGIGLINKQFPKIKLIIAQEDQELNPSKFILPGLGDFGDRFFGTL